MGFTVGLYVGLIRQGRIAFRNLYTTHPTDYACEPEGVLNGSFGYIPHRSAYAEGNYEVVSARCAEGSGEMLVDAAVGLLKELHAAGR